MGAVSLGCTLWSIPKELPRPRCLSAAVSWPVPAKISIAKNWCEGLPAHLARRRVVNDSKFNWVSDGGDRHE